MKSSLPTELEVTMEELGLPTRTTVGEINEVLSDYLSDRFGYCHSGFDWEQLDPWTVQVTNIEWDVTD